MDKQPNEIKFISFITLNRYLDRDYFGDSKLLSLIIFIALKVNRKAESVKVGLDQINLNQSEFLIGRPSTVRETDLSDQEFRTRFKKLQNLSIIEIVRTTNKYTIGKWLDNEVIDLNLEIKQPTNNQQENQSSTTNNNTNTSNNPLYSYISKNLYINKIYTYKEYMHVLKAYMHYKGIKLEGKETKNALHTIQDLFESKRTKDEIISFMKWLNKNENNEIIPWVKTWTIRTVRKKIPEFSAGKLYASAGEDNYADY